MKKIAGLFDHSPFLILFILSSLLLFKGLDHTLFWQDEGHVAVLARRILQFGYPKVWDGRNLLTGMDGLDFNRNYVLTWDGWFPYYLVAASFRLLGESTFAGRFPFVLCALATLPLFYGFVLRLTRRRITAFLSVFFMVGSIMFLLHSRQCRYYAVLPLGVVIVFWGLWCLPMRRGLFLTSLGFVLLYYSNLVSFACCYFSVLFIPLVLGWNSAKVRAFLVASVAVFLLTAPFFLYADMLHKSGTRAPVVWNECIGTMLGNLVFINKFYVPLLLLFIAHFYYKRRPHLKGGQYFRIGLVFLLVPVVLIAFVLGPTVRYIYHIFPIAAFLTALFLVDIWKEKRLAAIVLFLLIIFTHALDYLPFKAVFLAGDILQQVVPAPAVKALRYVYDQYSSVDDEEGPYRAFDKKESHAQMLRFYRELHIPTFQERFWRLEYRSYWDEITHPFPDNLPVVSQFLRENGKPDDGVYLNVGQCPMLFYNPDVRLVYSMTLPKKVNNDADPLDPAQWQWEAMTWFMPRPFSQSRGPFLTDGEFFNLVASKGWRVATHQLNVPAHLWDGNWPERYRIYRTLHGEYPMPRQEPQVIYQVLR